MVQHKMLPHTHSWPSTSEVSTSAEGMCILVWSYITLTCKGLEHPWILVPAECWSQSRMDTEGWLYSSLPGIQSPWYCLYEEFRCVNKNASPAPPSPGFSLWLFKLSQAFPTTQQVHLQCKRHRRYGVSPWTGKILWRRKWQPTPVFLREEDIVFSCTS